MEESVRAGLTADLGLLDVRPAQRFLDVGCGAGRHVVAADALGARALGLDVSRGEFPRTGGSFLLGDGARLPFRDATFDRVVCTEVLEHVLDPDAAVREIARVLAPAGRVAVSVPTSFTEDVFWRFRGYAFTPGGHIRIFRTGELARLLARNGLGLYDMRYRHSIASVYWLLRCLRGLRRPGPVLPGVGAASGRRLPIGDSWFIGRLEHVTDLFWPKSLVLYARR